MKEQARDSEFPQTTKQEGKGGMAMVRGSYGLSSLVAVVALIFWAVPAMSQELLPRLGQEQPGAIESQTQVSKEELKQTAAAYAKVTYIHIKFQQSVQSIEDQDERQRLQEEANQEVVQAIEDAGLDVEKYNSIMAQIRENEQTAERFNMQLQMLTEP